MSNFNDLPEAVRQEIYRLHLTYDEPIDGNKHNNVVAYTFDKLLKGKRYFMPPLLEVSDKIEREAAPAYYANNHFEASAAWTSVLSHTRLRHVRLVRRFTAVWPDTGAGYLFEYLPRFKGLRELCIRVDEKKMLKRVLLRRTKHNRIDWENPTPQQQLAIMQSPGMAGLLALCGKFANLEVFEFVKQKKSTGQDVGGTIPGGVLETKVAPRLREKKDQGQGSHSKGDTFDFLSLSPELRNQVYELLLCVPGGVQLSPKPPTSAPKRLKTKIVPQSVLSILSVNRQIHDEAVGIFYHYNNLIFDFTLHLQAFMNSLGVQRLGFVRNLTIHYSDVVSGGMSLVDVTFAQLQRFTGLRKLEIVLHGELANKITKKYWQTRYSMLSANPARLPGMRFLFELRNLTTIQVRDMALERDLKEAEAEEAFPDFAAGSRNAHVVKVSKALEHFNAALLQAQGGKVVHELLEDNQWQTRDVFPSLGGTS